MSDLILTIAQLNNGVQLVRSFQEVCADMADLKKASDERNLVSRRPLPNRSKLLGDPGEWTPDLIVEYLMSWGVEFDTAGGYWRRVQMITIPQPGTTIAEITNRITTPVSP